MVAARDGWPALAEVVSGLPDTATIYSLTLRLTPDDARRAAAEAWRLPEVAANTEALIARLVAAREAGPGATPSGAALRRYVELALPAYHFFVGIPQLPMSCCRATGPSLGWSGAGGRRERAWVPPPRRT